jgi:hypothetical protein
MGTGRYTREPCAPGVELYLWRWVGNGTVATAYVTDRTLACARRPWCLVMLRRKEGRQAIEILADYRSLKEANAAYTRHGERLAGLEVYQ